MACTKSNFNDNDQLDQSCSETSEAGSIGIEPRYHWNLYVAVTSRIKSSFVTYASHNTPFIETYNTSVKCRKLPSILDDYMNGEDLELGESLTGTIKKAIQKCVNDDYITANNNDSGTTLIRHLFYKMNFLKLFNHTLPIIFKHQEINMKYDADLKSKLDKCFRICEDKETICMDKVAIEFAKVFNSHLEPLLHNESNLKDKTNALVSELLETGNVKETLCWKSKALKNIDFLEILRKLVSLSMDILLADVPNREKMSRFSILRDLKEFTDIYGEAHILQCIIIKTIENIIQNKNENNMKCKLIPLVHQYVNNEINLFLMGIKNYMLEYRWLLFAIRIENIEKDVLLVEINCRIKDRNDYKGVVMDKNNMYLLKNLDAEEYRKKVKNCRVYANQYFYEREVLCGRFLM